MKLLNKYVSARLQNDFGIVLTTVKQNLHLIILRIIV
jgi:hypothetical protein